MNRTLKQGIVLFAHGSRDPLWSRPIEKVAEVMTERAPTTVVRCAYLELMKPDLATVIAQMVQDDVGTIQIAPLFLGIGKHAREDLPELVVALQASYPSIAFTLLPSIGEHPVLIECIATILSPN